MTSSNSDNDMTMTLLLHCHQGTEKNPKEEGAERYGRGHVQPNTSNGDARYR
jgi:hypothetical protein